MKRQSSLILLILASSATVAAAQGMVQPSGQPAAVGVTPQAAASANASAVPRADVATVVRTGPSAADRARQAQANVSDTDRRADMRSDIPTSSAASSTAIQPSMQPRSATDRVLPARADRN